MTRRRFPSWSRRTCPWWATCGTRYLSLQGELERLELTDWWTQLKNWKESYPERFRTDKALGSQEVINMLHEVTGGDCVVTTEVGQHQMFAARLFPTNEPRTWISSGGLGTMGFGLARRHRRGVRPPR